MDGIKQKENRAVFQRSWIYFRWTFWEYRYYLRFLDTSWGANHWIENYPEWMII